MYSTKQHRSKGIEKDVLEEQAGGAIIPGEIGKALFGGKPLDLLVSYEWLNESCRRTLFSTTGLHTELAPELATRTAQDRAR